MKLGVVIVTYNRLELLKECINACLNQTYKFEKIIIVNNNSSDGTTKFLKNINKKNMLIINLEKNIGGSGGFYEGVKESRNYHLDYLLLIDDDAILDKNYCLNISNYMIKCPNDIVGFSGTVKTNNIIQLEHRRYLKKNFKEINSNFIDYNKEYFDFELATFCGLFVSTEIINKIGFPEKKFFIWYDDTEYCLRINKFGKIRNINSAFLNHKTIISNDTGYNWKSYYGLRNRLYILKKYYSKRLYLCTKIKMKIMSFAAYLKWKIEKNKYYLVVSNMYLDAINDVKNDRFNLNHKYPPGLKLEKKEGVK